MNLGGPLHVQTVDAGEECWNGRSAPLTVKSEIEAPFV